MSATDTFLAKWSDVSAIGSAAAVLSWDQQTQMPTKGGAARDQALSVLAGLQHDKLTDPTLAEAIEEADSSNDGDAVLSAQVREARRDVSRAVAIPGELARRMAETQSRAFGVWQQAKADDDFAAFEPLLAEVIALAKEEAAALVAAGIAGRPYDALLDAYEPGATEAELAPLLGDLRNELAPLVKAVADGDVTVDESPALGDFPQADQREFGAMVAAALGYDFDGGRLDVAPHPFTTSFGDGDVRITWRAETDDFRPGLFGIMHEAGHAMYEQGLPSEHANTPIGRYVSLGIHESQSRLWENQVGRSKDFWRWALPTYQQQFPDKGDVTVDQMFKALHTVTPSFIRVEADEATYNLHIVARFELERQIIGGDVATRDLPELWATTYHDLLGIRPETAADGILQDIHWAGGAFGYFPTYTLGNLIAAQLFAAAGEQLDDLSGQIARGEFAPLLEWLRENVHRHGRLLTADEIVERATGAPLSSRPFLEYLGSVTRDVYGV